MLKRTISVVICAIMLTTLGGCAALLGSNSRANTLYVAPVETETAYTYAIQSTYGEYNVTLDKDSGEATIEKIGGEHEYYSMDYPTVLCGSDAPRDNDFCGEGYEPLPKLIAEKYENKKIKLVQYYGVEYGEEGVCRGFVNLYTRTSGYLSGGGRIDAKRIVAGVIFTFNTRSKEFTELYRLNKCNIVAYNESRAIYFRDRKYYVRDLLSGREKYLFDDEAYDTGMTNYSHASFYFNERHFIANMHHGANAEKREYDKLILTDYDGNVLISKKLTA